MLYKQKKSCYNNSLNADKNIVRFYIISSSQYCFFSYRNRLCLCRLNCRYE